MRFTHTSAAAISFAMILPLQCFAQDKSGFDQAVAAFATPLHCSWHVGTGQPSDGIGKSYGEAAVKVLEAGEKIGMQHQQILDAVKEACSQPGKFATRG